MPESDLTTATQPGQGPRCKGSTATPAAAPKAVHTSEELVGEMRETGWCARRGNARSRLWLAFLCPNRPTARRCSPPQVAGTLPTRSPQRTSHVPKTTPMCHMRLQSPHRPTARTWQPAPPAAQRTRPRSTAPTRRRLPDRATHPNPLPTHPTGRQGPPAATTQPQPTPTTNRPTGSTLTTDDAPRMPLNTPGPAHAVSATPQAPFSQRRPRSSPTFLPNALLI